MRLRLTELCVALSFLTPLFCGHTQQFATEAAITVLRIDDMIRLEKAEDDEFEE